MKTYTDLKQAHLEARKSKNVLVSNLLGTLVSEVDGQMKTKKDLDINDVLIVASKKFIKGIELGKQTPESYIELSILKQYIPTQLSDDEILNELKKLNLESIPNFGARMGIVMKNLKGKADGNDISRLVKQHYS